MTDVAIPEATEAPNKRWSLGERITSFLASRRWWWPGGRASSTMRPNCERYPRYGKPVGLRTVGLLLTLWCVLAIAPAFVIAVFMGVDTEDPSATVLLVWIGGYLAQIAVFFVITLKTGGGGFFGWLIASLVPWSANWVAPLSPWWLIACVAVVAGYSLWFYRSLTRSRIG